MRRHITPLRAIGAIAFAVAVTLLILIRIPSGQYLLQPDTAHPLAPFVRVQGARPAAGGTIYYVDVHERQASELDRLLPWLHPHSTFVPANDIVAPCSTPEQATEADFEEMAVSQRVGAAVALEHAGYHVSVHPNGVTVSQLETGTNAPCRLRNLDTIVSADETPTPTVASLHAALGRVKPGNVVTLGVKRGGKRLTVRVKTIDVKGHALIGIFVAQSARITLPIHVSIDLPHVGGPSAGLAFALEVMQMLGRKVIPPGYRVAATGEMEIDGTIGAIGGVEQKTFGVRDAGADVFLVPVAQGNAAEARRFAGPLRIIPVRTFSQALHALATLPPKQ